MLIGSMHHAARERGDFSSFEYQSRVFQRCDALSKSADRPILQNALETLCTVREEWYRKQQLLVPFDLAPFTGLCQDIVIEISEFLSIVEAIYTLSISILLSPRETHLKVHLINP